MKTYFLIRFDRFPRQEVTKILMKYMNEEEKPQFITTPSTLITIFKSESSYKEIYSALGKIEPPVAFFLIDVSDADVAIHMPENITLPIMEYLGKRKINKVEYATDESLKNSSKEELQTMLNEALENEQYELCSKIQNILNFKS